MFMLMPVFFIVLLLPASVEAENHQTNNLQAQSVYDRLPASANGIGKFYMGREIAHVMGHLGAGWLERPSREREERTDLLIKNMDLSTDDVVVDLGAGTGYFSFPMAAKVLEGKVFAVDIQEEMLAIIEQSKAERHVENMVTILAIETDPNIPPLSTDVVLMVDAYHEFSYPYEVMAAVVKGLKPGGRVVLVEYRGEDRSVPIKRLHKMTQQQVKKEMQAVGLQWLKTDNYLPQQHVMTFTKPQSKSSLDSMN
jgi:ubiquinone/menaquinone biosynthesis C-methylase UbiE